MDFHLAICLEILDHHPKAPTNHWFIVTQFFAPQVLLNDQRIFHVFPWVSPADCRLQGAIKDGFWVSPFKSKTGGSFGHVGNVSDIHHPQKLATCPSLIESSQIFQLALPNLSKSYFSKKYPQIKGISKSEKKKKTLEDIHHPFVPLGKNTKTSTVCSPCLLLEFHTAILRAPGGRCLCPCQCGLFGWQIEAAFLFATRRDVGSSIKTLESFPEVKKNETDLAFHVTSAQWSLVHKNANKDATRIYTSETPSQSSSKRPLPKAVSYNESLWAANFSLRRGTTSFWSPT